MTKVLRRRGVLLALSLMLTFTGLVSPSWAITLDDARAQGLVGERPDGLVGSVSANASTEVATLIAQINAARMDSYRALSARDGAPLPAVQAIAGEKLVERARQNGWYTMDAGGNWTR